MNKRKTVRGLGLGLGVSTLLAALLAGCGGGGGGGSTPPPNAAGSDVPQSALASPAAYTSFVASVAASASSTGAPLALGTITPPLSETDAAAAVQ